MSNVRFQIAILKAKKFLCLPFQWAALGLGFFGLYLILNQVILWMKSGYWVKMPLLYLLVNPWPEISANVPLTEIMPDIGKLSNPFIVLGVNSFNIAPDGQYLQPYRFFGLSEWLSQPHTWLGLHKILTWFLDFIPISLACIIIAFLVGGTAVYYSEIFQEELDSLSAPHQE